MNLDQLSPFCKTMHPCVGNKGDEKHPEYVIENVYPPYPWKMDGTDHSKDNAKFFFESCVSAGLAHHVRAADEPKSDERPITYTQWCELHRNDPDFVNNIEEMTK